MNQHRAGASEIVLVATHFPAAQQAPREAGSLYGKIVADATNPLLPTLDGLSVGLADSAAEQVPGEIWPAASGHARLRRRIQTPKRLGEPHCRTRLRRPDAGPLKQARVFEPFAMLWISLALQYGYGASVGFELLRRAS
jgi:8-hydroxy-5-deazaflavin:NADPH oxidoreductase